MPEVLTFDSYWEDEDERTTLLLVKYHYYPKTKGHTDRMGVPQEPDEEASVEVLNIRTADGQDPCVAVNDWDRDSALAVLEDQILATHVRTF